MLIKPCLFSQNVMYKFENKRFPNRMSHILEQLSLYLNNELFVTVLIYGLMKNISLNLLLIKTHLCYKSHLLEKIRKK